MAMRTSKTTADGDHAVEVTMARHVRWCTEYIHEPNITSYSRADRVRGAHGLTFLNFPPSNPTIEGGKGWA